MAMKPRNVNAPKDMACFKSQERADCHSEVIMFHLESDLL